MTIHTSGSAISLAQIKAEFGGSGTIISLGSYYRGGSLVSTSTAAGTGSSQTTPLTSRAPAQISTSSTIQLSQFYGTSAVTYSYGGTGGTYSANGASQGASDQSASAGFVLYTNGTAGGDYHNFNTVAAGYTAPDGSTPATPNWIQASNGSTNSGNFQFMWSDAGNAGSASCEFFDGYQGFGPFIAANTWTAVGSDISFNCAGVDETSSAPSVHTFLIQVRPVGSTTVVTSFYVQVSASFPHEGS